MIDEEYAIACTELLTILNNMSFKDYDKIPKEIITGLEEYKSTEYKFYLDYSKTLKEQNISELTKAMLSVLYKEYLASENKKKELESEERVEYIRQEEIKRQKYNPDDIFKKEEKKVVVATENELLPMVKEETWLEKAKNFLKSLFRR